MSKGNTFENDWLKLIFNGTAIDDLADNDATSPLTSLYVSLHTANPGEAGNQTTSEANYTGYARIAVARNSGGWTVVGGSVTNTAAITFPQSSGVQNVITHFGIGTALSGTGKLLYIGALASNFTVLNNTVPTFQVAALEITED